MLMTSDQLINRQIDTTLFVKPKQFSVNRVNVVVVAKQTVALAIVPKPVFVADEKGSELV